MLELKPRQIIFKLSAAHLHDCCQWQRAVEAKRGELDAVSPSQVAPITPTIGAILPSRNTGAIRGAYTYTLRPTIKGYHLNVRDAISRAEQDWSATAAASDFVVFATLVEPEYERLCEWFAQFQCASFEQWLQTELVYQFCDTTLGRITRVRAVNTGAQLDLTDYQAW